jgi:hypothetical protein
MEQIWNQMEIMQAAKQQIVCQIGELYMQLEDIEIQRKGIKNTINSMRSQLLMISKTYAPMKDCLIKSLGLKDGVYEIDFVNRRVVPNEQVSDIGNSESGPGNRVVWSGSNGGDPDNSHSEVE